MRLLEAADEKDKDAARLFGRLFKFARKLGADSEFAMDLAAHAYTDAFAAGVVEWHYASVCLKHAYVTIRRDRKRRNEDYAWTFVPGTPEPLELQRMTVQPDQETVVRLSEVMRLIAALPEPYRTAIRLAGLEYTAEEIAWEMQAPVKDVYWWLQHARKRLRKADPDLAPVRRGHARFHGIRKDHHRWSAALRVKGAYFSCGYHADAESAARAYDEKAKEVLGPLAKLNFPEEQVA